jgi:hypothetical protein
VNEDLLLMVPTRNRPQNVIRFLESWEDSGSVTDLVFLDDYDASSRPRTHLPVMPWGARVPGFPMWMPFPDEPTTTGKLNACAAQAIGRGYKHLMFIGDDHVIETRNWDQRLLEALRVSARGTGWVYPADGRRSDVPEICLISSDIVLALGWFALPASKHGYIDHAWSDLGLEMDRIVYVPEVMIRHKHYRTHKDVPRDDVYDRGEEWAPRDGDAYLHWRDHGGKTADVGKLRATGLFN